MNILAKFNDTKEQLANGDVPLTQIARFDWQAQNEISDADDSQSSESASSIGPNEKNENEKPK